MDDSSRKAERPYHRQVEVLKQDIVQFSELAVQSVTDAVDSLKNIDRRLADKVIRNDDLIDKTDVEIERKAMELIALHQPMAIDLRVLGTSLKIITYLDRIGRYARDIAEVTLKIADQGHYKKVVTIPHMRDIAVGMVADAVKAYMNEDSEVAESVYDRDDSVDALYDEIFRECLTYMMEDSKKITQSIHYILVARYLERIADNSCKIAEKAIYIATGRRRREYAEETGAEAPRD